MAGASPTAILVAGTLVVALISTTPASAQDPNPSGCLPLPKSCPLAPPAADAPLFRDVCMTRAQGAEPPNNRCLPWNVTLPPTASKNFTCGCCGHALFSADDIYDAHTGWPAFRKALPGGVCVDHRHFGTETRCAHCGAHLGDFFPPSHFCIDGVCLHPPKNPEYTTGCEVEH